MTLEEIKAIIKEFDKSGLSFLEIEGNESKIKLKKSKMNDTVVVEKVPTKTIRYETDIQQNTISDNTSQNIQDTTVMIKAPLVGVFYERPDPDAKPYITVGQSIKKGEIVCLIEAMKMINEVKAPVSGIIKRILVKNEALVSYNEMLMEIEEQ